MVSLLLKSSSKENIHTGRIVPIYSETKGITSNG
jgi:hypothetical protein